jgi:hypothetical protein
LRTPKEGDINKIVVSPEEISKECKVNMKTKKPPTEDLVDAKRHFKQSLLPSIGDSIAIGIRLRPNTSPLELLKYDVILVSCAFVTSQYRKLYNYIDGVAKFKNNSSGGHLERPSVSIFSEIFHTHKDLIWLHNSCRRFTAARFYSLSSLISRLRMILEGSFAWKGEELSSNVYF